MIGFIMMGGSVSLETQIHRKLPEGGRNGYYPRSFP